MVLFFGGITKSVISKSNVDACGICNLRAKTSSVLCFQCGKWVHGRCAGVKMVTAKFS